MILYAVAHQNSGQLYIGWSSRSLRRRRNEHRYNAFNRGSKIHFHNALRKYGMDAFEWWVIAEYDTVEEAKYAEIAWIAYLRKQNIELFNKTNGGDHHNGFSGKKHSLATRQRMTQERTGRKLKTVYRGEEAGHSRLTRQQVNEIKDSSLTYKELSKMYGVHVSHIGHIKSGRRWS